MIGFNLQINAADVREKFTNLERQIMPVVIQDLAIKLRNEVEGLTPVGRDNERPEGQRPMKMSWSGIAGAVSGGFMYFENEVPHASVIEFGLYPRQVANPQRTAIHTDGNRYSTQAMGGVLRPLLENGIRGMSIEEQAQAVVDELLAQLMGR